MTSKWADPAPPTLAELQEAEDLSAAWSATGFEPLAETHKAMKALTDIMDAFVAEHVEKMRQIEAVTRLLDRPQSQLETFEPIDPTVIRTAVRTAFENNHERED